MSASHPGPVRRFFRALWRFIDASRRVVLNLVFLLILVAIAVALIKTGPAPIADKTALVLRLDGTISEQKTGTLRSSALDQVRGEAVQKILLRDVLAALDSAAADPKISSLVVILDEMRPTGFATLREIAAGVDRFKASGKKVVAWGSSLRPAPVLHRLARRRALPAPARHGLPLGLRQPAQLLQGRARQARRHRQRDARRHLQERGRALHRQRAFAGCAEADGVLYGGLWGPTSTQSRRSASFPPARSRAPSTRPAAARRGRRRCRQARAGREAGRRAEDARRAARAHDRARRQATRRADLPPDLVRRLPGARQAARHRRGDRRRRRRGRDRRRHGAGRHRRRRCRPPT